MEGNQQNSRKKNMSIKLLGRGAGGGGGGLAGVIFLGGALALVTTFAFKRKRNSKSEKNKQEESLNKSIVGDGLSFLVPECLSPHLKNHPDYSISNGTVVTQDEVSRQILLDENSEANVGNDKEMDIPEKPRDSTFCDESSIDKEEFPVPVAGSLLPLKLGLNGKADKEGEACEENGRTVIEREEILVGGAQSDQPEMNVDSHKFDKECNGDKESILEKREEPVEAAVVDQTRLDDKPHIRGDECDGNADIISEKGEELTEEVAAANGMIWSEELEATTMYGDQDILCFDGTVLITNETCDLKKPELLLPPIDSSLVIKPGDNAIFEDSLVVDDTKMFRGDEANKPAVQEDHSKVKDVEKTQLVETNGDNKVYYKIYRENTNDKCKEADEITVENDQQMQSEEECQKIHINGDDEKYNSCHSLPEINSFQSNDFEVKEFSFPLLDSPSLFKPGQLHKYDPAETTLHMGGVINPVEKNGLAEEVFASQIMLENMPSVKSAENDETLICDDGCDSAASKGEETLNMSLGDIAQPTKLSEDEDNIDGRKEVEAVEIFQRENFQVENNLQLPQKDHNCNDNVGRKEYDNDCDNGDVEDDKEEEEENSDSEEEEDVEEVEESSETTAASSLDSNAEVIWPNGSVLEFLQKEMQAKNQQNFKEIEEEDSYVRFNSHKLEDDEGESFMMGCSDKLSADTTKLKQPTNIFKLKFWFLSLLVCFLLLLWLCLSQLSYFPSFQYHLE